MHISRKRTVLQVSRSFTPRDRKFFSLSTHNIFIHHSQSHILTIFLYYLLSLPPSSCTSRFIGDHCELTNPCQTGASQRCQNGGTCSPVLLKNGAPSFVCQCPIGYTASLCEIPEKNACDSSPCKNHGNCVLKSLEEYECRCGPGYSGRHCEKQNICSSSPCKHGGTCQMVAGGKFKCHCPSGFKGETCEEDIEECLKRPCRHGGKCINTHGSYQCNCEPGYTGKNCESKYIPCSPSPCQNGGTCRQSSAVSYECKCPPGKRWNINMGEMGGKWVSSVRRY